MICARRAPSCFYPYVTHVINFTRLPPFSACNIENMRETGDEASGRSQLLIGGVSLYHHNKVINIIANLCVWGGGGDLMAYTSQFSPALRLSYSFQKCKIEKIQLCKSTN